jgi:hypothetical protein
VPAAIRGNDQEGIEISIDLNCVNIRENGIADIAEMRQRLLGRPASINLIESADGEI